MSLVWTLPCQSSPYLISRFTLKLSQDEMNLTAQLTNVLKNFLYLPQRYGYTLIAFDERVTFWLQRAGSLPCANAFAALHACAIAQWLYTIVYNRYDRYFKIGPIMTLSVSDRYRQFFYYYRFPVPISIMLECHRNKPKLLKNCW